MNPQPPPRERPIPFSAPMVRAILDCRKTQTRRPVAPNLMIRAWGLIMDGEAVDLCPYGQPGDRLWVRETFMPRIDLPRYRADEDRPEWAGLWKPSIFMPRKFSRITLELTAVRVERVQEISEEDAKAEGSYLGRCNCMPRSKDLGIMKSFRLQKCHIHGSEFRYLWDSINAKRGFGWDANPWVWCLTFKRV